MELFIFGLIIGWILSIPHSKRCGRFVRCGPETGGPKPKFGTKPDNLANKAENISPPLREAKMECGGRKDSPTTDRLNFPPPPQPPPMRELREWETTKSD